MKKERLTKKQDGAMYLLVEKRETGRWDDHEGCWQIGKGQYQARTILALKKKGLVELQETKLKVTDKGLAQMGVLEERRQEEKIAQAYTARREREIEEAITRLDEILNSWKAGRFITNRQKKYNFEKTLGDLFRWQLEEAIETEVKQFLYKYEYERDQARVKAGLEQLCRLKVLAKMEVSQANQSNNNQSNANQSSH